MFDALMAAAQAVSLVLGLSGDPGPAPAGAPVQHEAPQQGEHK